MLSLQCSSLVPAVYPVEIDENKYFSYIKLLQALVMFLESRRGHDREAVLPLTSPCELCPSAEPSLVLVLPESPGQCGE